MNTFYRSKIYERLAPKTKIIDNNCHIWTGSKDDNGYGTTHLFGRMWKVHVLAALFFLDLDIDTKITTRHLCNNRACFNHTHLKIKIK